MNSGFLERFGKVFAPVVFDMNRNIDVSNKFCELYAKGDLREKNWGNDYVSLGCNEKPFDSQQNWGIISSFIPQQSVRFVSNIVLNFQKINSKYKTDQKNFEFVEDMVLAEKQNGAVIVTDALQWLRRWK